MTSDRSHLSTSSSWENNSLWDRHTMNTRHLGKISSSLPTPYHTIGLRQAPTSRTQSSLEGPSVLCRLRFPLVYESEV